MLNQIIILKLGSYLCSEWLILCTARVKQRIFYLQLIWAPRSTVLPVHPGVAITKSGDDHRNGTPAAKQGQPID